MYFTREAMTRNPRMVTHWNELWANRNIFNTQQAAMVEQYRPSMTPEQLACNAIQGLDRTFWAEIDAQVIQLRTEVDGMEILLDLQDVQTVLPIAKTAKLYNMVGDIAEDVSVSLDGQAPYSFDHTEYASDGDPVPMFTAGYGVNWRHAAGLQSVGIDLILDSQRAKLRKFNESLVSYMLDGKSTIQVDAYPGQGIRNHRNTIKVDLGQGGADIDLTTATAEELLAFFGQNGPFGQMARANKVGRYDVMWVSYEIWANMARPYLININAGSNAVIAGDVLRAILPFVQVAEIRPTYALTGNEFIAYQRSRESISPLVGMTTGVVPLPRPMPQHNYNFQIMAAMGMQIKKDAAGKSSVVYGTNITTAPAP